MKYEFVYVNANNACEKYTSQGICTITSARYAVSCTGIISIEISTDNGLLDHAALITLQDIVKTTIADYGIIADYSIVVYVDTPIISEGSIYEVYTHLPDPQNLFPLSAVYLRNISGMTATRQVSLVESPTRCPSCEGQLATSFQEPLDATGTMSSRRILRCNNVFCSAKRLGAFARFMTIAMGAPQLVRPLLEFIRANLAAQTNSSLSIADIFLITPQMLITTCGMSPILAEKFVLAVKRMHGHVRFGDFLCAISTIDYLNVDPKLNLDVLYGFEDPFDFFTWVKKIGDPLTKQGMTFSAWMEYFADKVEQCCSVQFYWELYRWYFDTEVISNQTLVNLLYQRQVFEPFKNLRRVGILSLPV